MNRSRLLRKGFTLAEILVALALIALLAAVLLPTVAGQILKGDAGRVLQDVSAIRAGIEQFLADVHRYPSRYSDLSTLITTSGTDINGNVYTSGLVGKWAGPYVTKDVVPVETGFAGSIQNVFKIQQASNAVNYVSIIITGINGPDFDKVDLQVDGTGTTRTTGLFRWVSTGGVDSTKFLAVPIQ